eukprot:357274-Chlamydomonas_euryale.AAC.8
MQARAALRWQHCHHCVAPEPPDVPLRGVQARSVAEVSSVRSMLVAAEQRAVNSALAAESAEQAELEQGALLAKCQAHAQALQVCELAAGVKRKAGPWMEACNRVELLEQQLRHAGVGVPTFSASRTGTPSCSPSKAPAARSVANSPAASSGPHKRGPAPSGSPHAAASCERGSAPLTMDSLLKILSELNAAQQTDSRVQMYRLQEQSDEKLGEIQPSRG